MKLEVNREQLELLKFMVLHYEYDDDKEREVVEQLEFKLYEIIGEIKNEHEKKLAEAQAKQPKAEW